MNNYLESRDILDIGGGLNDIIYVTVNVRGRGLGKVEWLYVIYIYISKLPVLSIFDIRY